MTAVSFPLPASGEPVTRRALLAGVGLGAAAVAVAAGGTGLLRPDGTEAARRRPAGPGVLPASPEALPGLAAFAAAVGSSFVVEAGLRGRRVVLDEALDLTAPRRPNEAATVGDHFSLVFRGPAGRTLPGGSHPLRHPGLGTLTLHLEPVGRGVRGQDYQAVVDHRRPVARPVPGAHP